MYKHMGTSNYNYQIPREGSDIHYSGCNTWKDWKTISKNKHCCHFWWLHPTVWKGEQQHKSDSSGSTLHVSHFPKKHAQDHQPKLKWLLSKVRLRFNTKKKVACYFLKESYTTVNFLQPSFLKKGGLKTFPATSTECRGITQWKRENIVNTLKGVPQSAHSFQNAFLLE